ncbi:MAG: molybdate ABC transporter substrate-binding protein [Bacillota bacterium]
MLRLFALIIVLLFSTVVVAESITVSAAVSLKEAMDNIARSYEADTSERVNFSFGSSGQLMAQIKSGAPVDLFISAAGKQVDDLSALGLVDDTTRRIVAGNALVLIVPANAKRAPSTFKDLTDSRYGRLAIGEPQTVPAGQYAMQVMTTLKLADLVADRVVYGSNVRQVLDYVGRGEVAAGVVYATDAKQPGSKVRIVATADCSWHDPIQYPAVVVKASRRQAAAKRFLNYLSSRKAREILANKGFVVESDPDVEETSP